MTPSVNLRATWYAASSRMLTYDAPSITTCNTALGNCGAFDHSGARSSQAGFREGVGLDFSFPLNLSASASVMWMQSLLYPLDSAVDPTTGLPIPASDYNTDWRYVMAYSIGAEWKPISHLAVGAGVSTVNPEQAPDSTYYAPFFNRYTQLYLEVRGEL